MAYATGTAPVDNSPSYPTVALNTGSTAVFTAVIAASPAPTYQWKLNGVALTDSATGSSAPSSDIIAGSAGPQLVITNATSASNGSYTCLASNGNGSVTTAASVLTVSASSSPGSLSNISSRALVKTGDNILIGGFYITGSTSRTVLIQAIGPSLAPPPFNVSGTLSDPALAIHTTVNGQDETLYMNQGWSSSDTAANNILLNAAASVYANPVLTVGSKDSELLLTLAPGGYTAEVYGASNDTGVALVGIYELN